MGSLDRKPLKIIGAGKIVQAAFLDNQLPDDCEIYDIMDSRKSFLVKNINSFRPSNSITILCASVQEAELLKTSDKVNSRLVVAKANLSLVQDLLMKGVFDTGLVLVVTNPSELIAEFIYRNTLNKNVYALGLGVDKKRYDEILRSKSESEGTDVVVSTMAGNHYDFPYPILKGCDSARQTEKLIKMLKQDLKIKIAQEFNGYNPPLESGVFTLLQALKSVHDRGQLLVSGYCDGLHCFSGGILEEEFFAPSLGDSYSEKQAIRSIAAKHLKTYEKITQTSRSF